MTQRTNRFGLTDYIPAEVRRAVRQQCGFGCVVCGLAIAQYEHFDPPCEDAEAHRPEGIAYLCGSCHDKKTRSIWSPQKIAAARQNPITFRHGYARDAFDLTSPFTLWLGSSAFQNVNCIVKTGDGTRWLTIDQPEASDGPLRLSATFCDDAGVPSLVIENNEWRVLSSQWDTDVEGPRLTVRRAPGDIALECLAEPPHALRLVRLRMRLRDIEIGIDRTGEVALRQGVGVTILDACAISGADAVLLF